MQYTDSAEAASTLFHRTFTYSLCPFYKCCLYQRLYKQVYVTGPKQPFIALALSPATMAELNKTDSVDSSCVGNGGMLSFGNTPWTASEIAAISRHLTRPVAPEVLAERAGPASSKLVYLEGWRAPQLANKAFGFNGWSSKIVRFEVDMCQKDKNGYFEVGLAAVVRVTLKDGTHREDIGYGSAKDRSRSIAIDHARKSSITDGLKRALKQFGPALGSNLLDSTFVNFAKRVLKQDKYGRDYSKANMLGVEEVDSPEPCYAYNLEDMRIPQELPQQINVSKASQINANSYAKRKHVGGSNLKHQTSKPVPAALNLVKEEEEDDDDFTYMCSQDFAKVDDLCTAACSGDGPHGTGTSDGLHSISPSFPKRRRVGQK